jgi:putative transposase
LDHQTPEWKGNDATFFVTICTDPRGVNQLCSSTVGREILNSIKHYHEQRRWFCHLAVLMPDHVHFLLSFPDVKTFSPIIGDWKRWLTLRHKVSWQENFFDHRIRNEDNDKWKADYIFQNPVRAGLVERAEDWPYAWMPQGKW